MDSMPHRLARLLVVLTSALVTATAGAASPARSELPNVVLILMDDLGYGDVGCFGAPDLLTPHIDRLARHGMRWTNFYANSPVCSPTRAALLSGRYPDAVGVPGVIRTHAWNSFGLLRGDVELLPAALTRAGYDTALVGKWHLGLAEPNTPGRRGFGHVWGFLGDMMDDYLTHRRHGVNYLRHDDREIDPEGHATDLFSEAACRWLSGRSSDRPFFLYLAYNAPHDPIQPPEAALAAYLRRHPQADPARARLAALIEHADAGIGRVLECLHRTGHDRRTLVIFTSDNGGSLRFAANNGGYRAGKTTMYEGGLRVPLIASWPGRIPAGTTCSAVALSMDLYPTLVELAGLPAVAGTHGVTLVPLLLGRQADLPPRDLFWVWLEKGYVRAARQGRFKILDPAPGKPRELYDLQADPHETTDLAATQPELYARMNALVESHIARFADVPYRPASGPGPGETLEKPARKPAAKR